MPKTNSASPAQISDEPMFCDECGYLIEPIRGDVDRRWHHELPQGVTYSNHKRLFPKCFNNPKPARSRLEPVEAPKGDEQN